MHDITDDHLVAERLEGAGYDVVRCNDGTNSCPCTGATGSCPLDGSVDVAVVVHDRPSVDLAVGEVGVICALRDGIPVVVAGNHTQSPFDGRCDGVAGHVDDVPEACQRARTAAMSRASEFVTQFTGGDADVVRHGHRVEVVLGSDATERQAVRAHQAAFRLFPSARTIDVRRQASTRATVR